MAYISSRCLVKEHEECVSGMSVFNIGERELCACPCHDSEAKRIATALAAGWTKQELKRMWYQAREPQREG